MANDIKRFKSLSVYVSSIFTLAARTISAECTKISKQREEKRAHVKFTFASNVIDPNNSPQISGIRLLVQIVNEHEILAKPKHQPVQKEASKSSHSRCELCKEKAKEERKRQLKTEIKRCANRTESICEEAEEP